MGAGLKALAFIQITESLVPRERENQLTLIIRSQPGRTCGWYICTFAAVEICGSEEAFKTNFLCFLLHVV